MNADGTKKFYGRYRGTVASNVDPKQLGRLLVVVPDVLGDESCIWAESATPLRRRPALPLPRIRRSSCRQEPRTS